MDAFDFLQKQEARERGFLGSMVADQNFLATMGHNYPLEEAEFEHLFGPAAPVMVKHANDVVSMRDVGFNRRTLAQWYFGVIDGFRQFFRSLRKYARMGHPLYMDDLYAVADALIYFDECAEIQGWKLDRFSPTAFDRLESEFKSAERLTVERQRKLRHKVVAGKLPKGEKVSDIT